MLYVRFILGLESIYYVIFISFLIEAFSCFRDYCESFFCSFCSYSSSVKILYPPCPTIAPEYLLSNSVRFSLYFCSFSYSCYSSNSSFFAFSNALETSALLNSPAGLLLFIFKSCYNKYLDS